MEIGLGGRYSVPLAEARKRAQKAREALITGVSLKALFKPISQMPNFGECADEYIKYKSKSWSNIKHVAQWETSLSGNYNNKRIKIDPIIQASHVTALNQLRSTSVDKIVTDDILAVLRPIWTLKSESANRIRGRIEAVLSYAKARGFRSGENPAAWRGHLAAILPARSKLARGHQKAIDYQNLPSFILELRSRESVSRLCLELLILTATRSAEARGAKWQEIDLASGIWTIPAIRMKARTEHRIPLTDAMIKILLRMREISTSDLVFEGAKQGYALTDTALSKLTKELGGDITAHGFRSAFRDWCGDKTNYPREVAEAALAHVIENKAEAAYRRSDAIEKRRALMSLWSNFCNSESQEKVIKFHQVV